jgi:hypothetical protein
MKRIYRKIVIERDPNRKPTGPRLTPEEQDQLIDYILAHAPREAILEVDPATGRPRLRPLNQTDEPESA